MACAVAQPSAAFVSGHYVVTDANGVRTSDLVRPCVMSDHYRALLCSNYIGMHATVLYRRETLERHGGFDLSMPASEDYDLFLRVARREAVVCHPEVVAEYRWHGANMSMNSALMLSTTLRVLARQRAHVRGNPAYEAAYRSGVAFWQGLYGDPLLDEVGRRLRTGASWSVTARMLAVLLRWYPLGLARRAARVTKRLSRGRVWRG
jgi:hypothetical protein